MSIRGGRTYNLDLLRIVAMVMIVTLHFLGVGKILSVYPDPSLKYYAAWSVESVCLIAVNCYVLLSGYFLVHSQFRIKKLVTLAVQVIFYSLGLYLLLLATGVAKFSFAELFNATLPTLSGVYWFVTIYMAMYALSPFLNRLLLNLNKQTHLALITALIFIFSVWPTFFVLGDKFTFASLNIANGYSAIWFIVLYCVAAYLRQYYQPTFQLKKYLARYVIVALSVAALFTITSFVGTQTHNEYFTALSAQIHGYNSLPIFAASITLFLVFANLKITSTKINKSIATLSPLTFGVYLIHQEPHVNIWLWTLINPSLHAFSPLFVPYAALIILTVYAVCSLIDWGRVQLFVAVGKLYLFQRISGAVLGFINQLPDKATRIVDRSIS